MQREKEHATLPKIASTLDGIHLARYSSEFLSSMGFKFKKDSVEDEKVGRTSDRKSIQSLYAEQVGIFHTDLSNPSSLEREEGVDRGDWRRKIS